jgi:hypothetical protein
MAYRTRTSLAHCVRRRRTPYGTFLRTYTKHRIHGTIVLDCISICKQSVCMYQLAYTPLGVAKLLASA